MQYKIKLGKDYNINKIIKRVQENGYKTDGFNDLFLKLYLINNNLEIKECSPLYLFHQHDGVNEFIFNGYYDNIINSFGEQKIEIGMPLLINIDQEEIQNIKYVYETYYQIGEDSKLDFF